MRTFGILILAGRTCVEHKLHWRRLRRSWMRYAPKSGRWRSN